MWGAVKLWAAGVNWARVGLLALGAAAVIGTYSGWVYSKGHAAAALGCSTGALASNEKAGTDHAKEETKVYALPPRDLRDEYSRWLY